MMRMAQARSLGRIVWRLTAVGGMALASGLPLRAENESLTRFWLDQQAVRTQPFRPAVRRHARPAPRRPAVVVERRAAPESTPLPAKAAATPGFVVGVFGDMFGGSIVRGLPSGATTLPGTTVVDQTGDDGELTRIGPDVWRAAIATAAARAGRLDAAVIMLGGNEIGLPASPDQPAGADTAWRTVYGDAAEQLAALFREKTVPLIWVGLPPVRDPDEARRFLALNAIVRERAAKAGAVYIDIWEAFTDDNGDYTAVGPDVDGQTAKLRRSDGRGFTFAGAHKLASFVESDLKRIRAGIEAAKSLASVSVNDQSLFDQALQIDVNAQIRREAGLPPLDAAAAQSTAALQSDGPVLLLTGAPVASDGKLATLYDGNSRLTGLAAATLDRGLPPPAQPGRADDFTWPRR